MRPIRFDPKYLEQIALEPEPLHGRGHEHENLPGVSPCHVSDL
jgi:hypothetical protein